MKWICCVGEDEREKEDQRQQPREGVRWKGGREGSGTWVAMAAAAGSRYDLAWSALVIAAST
jgi:hypothetical protein